MYLRASRELGGCLAFYLSTGGFIIFSFFFYLLVSLNARSCVRIGTRARTGNTIRQVHPPASSFNISFFFSSFKCYDRTAAESYAWLRASFGIYSTVNISPSVVYYHLATRPLWSSVFHSESGRAAGFAECLRVLYSVSSSK